MRHKYLITIVTFVATSVLVRHAGNTGISTDTGWVRIFDGRSLSGWIPEGQAKWRVVDDAIVSDAGGSGWLRSSRRYKSFALRCKYRNVPKGNSGIFFRATKETRPGEPNPVGGYELQINNEDEKWPTGSIEDFVQRNVSVNPAPNVWHSYELVANGDRFVATLDGTKVLDGRDGKFESGYIGLQHHEEMKIEFRDIQVREVR